MLLPCIACIRHFMEDKEHCQYSASYYSSSYATAAYGKVSFISKFVSEAAVVKWIRNLTLADCKTGLIQAKSLLACQQTHL